MEDRIKAVMAEDSLDDESRGFEFAPDKETAKTRPDNEIDRDDDDKKTIKIEMSNRLQTKKPPALLQHPTSESGTLKSKLKLSSRRRTPNDESHTDLRASHLPIKQHEENQSRLQESLREYERMSLKSIESRTNKQSQRTNGLFADLDQTQNNTPKEKKGKYMESNNQALDPLSQSNRDIKEEDQVENNEFQLFYERETNYTFWSFMTSKQIPIYKKLANGYFLIVFILATAMSVLAMVMYSESSCHMSLGVSVVYYIYFGLSILMRFSFYIFMQLELHGKIAYSIKVVPSNAQIPHLVPLVIALCIPAILIGFYSFNYKECRPSSVLFDNRSIIEMLATRLGITYLVYIGFFVLSGVLTSWYT